MKSGDLPEGVGGVGEGTGAVGARAGAAGSVGEGTGAAGAVGVAGTARAGAVGAAGTAELVVRPIGVVRSPFVEKVSAPRQAVAARGVEARIELYPLPGMEHAVSDLETCDHVWVLFWFHEVNDFRPKVLPPRSTRRRGVLATRAPHRPNPIGMSVVRLDRVEGLTLHIRDVDMLDGTPVLDVKPYVPYADSVPHARVGWLMEEEAAAQEARAEGERAGEGRPAEEGARAEGARAEGARAEGARANEGARTPADPLSGYDVTFEPDAAEVLDFLKESFGVELAAPITSVLSLGPQPHPYRRIRKAGEGWVLAVKDWRARFRVEGRRVRVTAIETGYRPKQLVEGVVGGVANGKEGVSAEVLAPHRAVWERSKKKA